MSLLAERLLDIHQALQKVHLAHAFGGAIALAYCTEEPRGTRDLDVNVFVPPDCAPEVFAALPGPIVASPVDTRAAERDGQVRLWWEDTPVDLFLDVHDFHRKVFRGIRWVPFEDQTIPVIGCTALAVFKALLDRTKDWADIEAMLENDNLDAADAIAELSIMLGSDSAPVRRLSALAS